MDDGKRLLSIFGVFLWVFVLLGAVHRVFPEVKSVFPLLGGVSTRLDRVAWELKAGSPIPEAAEAFFHETLTSADSN